MAEISPLRRRMIEDMTVRNLSPATQRSYLAAVSKLSRYFGRSPDCLELEDIRAFQVHLVAIGISWPALNQIVCALRFFYGVTLGHDAIPERITYARQPSKLPVVLSADEVVRFLEAIPSLKSRTALTTVYAAGLRDMFGNWCSRIVAPAGHMRLFADGVIRDSGLPDPVFPGAGQHAIEDLPADTLVYLLGSRYCETEMLSEVAWKLFESTPPGWARVQAICDFVHRHIAFGYGHARATMTAWQVYSEGKGVCRDYAHLATTFCRCMNIPARYCTGYLGDMGTPRSADVLGVGHHFAKVPRCDIGGNDATTTRR
jgi:hypothetical protein